MMAKMTTASLVIILLSAMIVILQTTGQACHRTCNQYGLPELKNYQDTGLKSAVIPSHHQAIIPSYVFECYGNITEWGFTSTTDDIYAIIFQVWRPSPAVETTGCYSLVGSNRFTALSLDNDVAVVTPLPQERIQFQPGDVMGFYMESARGDGRGVVVVSDLRTQGDRGYETEQVWYATVPSIIINPDPTCIYAVGLNRHLDTFTNVAPILSVSYVISTATTVMNIGRTCESSTTSGFTHSYSTQTTLLTIGGTVISAITLVILLTTFVAIAVCMRVYKRGDGTSSNSNNEEPFQTTTTHANSEDVIYDYPTMNFENAEFIDTIQNEAYQRISEHLSEREKCNTKHYTHTIIQEEHADSVTTPNIL